MIIKIKLRNTVDQSKFRKYNEIENSLMSLHLRKKGTPDENRENK